MAGNLEDTTIRDFGGGWNVSDSDLNLNSKYQPISDNVVRGIDGSLSVRQGVALYTDFQDGDETIREGTFNIEVFDTHPHVFITIVGHGLSNGDHLTLSGMDVDFNGISASSINGTHSVIVEDSDTLKIYTNEIATADANIDKYMTAVLDDHLLGGNIIHTHYFNRRLLVFTDIGEVGTVADDGTRVRIWGADIAEQLTPGLVPTRRCTHWSSDTFKSTVIACNGHDKDKPIQIFDNFQTEFLVDKATHSNASVPKADYVVCLQRYVCFIRTEFGDPFIEFSAAGTDGTFTRESDPVDAAEVDLSMITGSVEPVLLGGAAIRDKLYTAFYDKGMIGTLGVYNTNGDHVPDFSDTISEHGTISHRTMVSLGNDVLMCDYAGVPSVTISQQSGIFVPVRLSELIAPALQKHLSSLGEDLLRTKAFAVYNRNDRSYMLFLPIYDPKTYPVPTDPFVFNDELRKKGYALMNFPGHTLFEDSYIRISGATSVGGLDAGQINGTRRVVSVVDDNAVVVELGGAPTSNDITSGGGNNVTVRTINNETIVYVFEYNREFKIRRWTRYRGWNFDCGATSQRGKLFLCKGLKVYRMGDNEIPVHADFVDDYDYIEWQNNELYSQGMRVRDQTSNIVYICNETHTSPSTGTFADNRAAYLDRWSVYEGEPIKWAVETPWSDMRERGRYKINKYISFDSEGYDNFTVSAFVNKIRNDPATNDLMPIRSLQFQAGESGGWGVQLPGNFGGGRRTRDQKVWPFHVRGKLIRWRYEGRTTKRVRIISHTMYYTLGNK